MRFASPEYFWLFFCIPLFVGFFIWAYQHKRAALSRFASAALIQKISPETGLTRQILKWILFLLFFFFLIWPLVRPHFGVKEQQMDRKVIDIMVALDISESML